MRYFIPLLVVFAAALYLNGCTDTVYRDAPVYEQPSAGAGEFLGYKSEDTKLTTCGQCHVGFQNKWVLSAHADAWNTLEESGHSQTFCEPCHTTGPNGSMSEEGGHNGAPEARYHDVQCENCHGSGLLHVSAPDGTAPLASINVASDPPTSCAQCHTGNHHPFVEEWEKSAHATPVSYTLGRESCVVCHTAQGALESWGVNADYVEKDAASEDHLGIVCAVCHDPHQSDNPGQLRFPLDAASKENNLCIKCHHKRAEPDVEAEVTRGPHSPEGPLILGEQVGWWPPGFEDPGQVAGTHGSERNERLCATCHVVPTTITDQETGEFVFHATGHLFTAIPCTDENGQPLPEEDCETSERSFEACAGSGCHATPQVARTVYTSTKGDIEALAQDLEDLLAQVDESELDPRSGVFTVAKGANFNVQLALLPGSSTHNPFVIRQLLRASIEAVEEEYGVSAPRPLGQLQ